MPDQNSIWSTKRLIVTMSSQNALQITHPGSIWNLQPIILPNHPAWVHPNFPTQNPSKSSIQSPFKIYHGKSILSPNFIPIHLPKQNSTKYPRSTAWTKTHPHNPLPNNQHMTNPLPSPTLLTLSPPLINLTHGNTRPYWRSQSSHCTVQGLWRDSHPSN